MPVGRPSRPVLLAPNPIQHFYAGGARIAELRGVELPSDHCPEEWVGATITRYGEEESGLARTDGGDLVRDLVAADPVGWLGEAVETVRRAGDGDTGLLVKLLDAGQRLPVHVHPSRRFSRAHLDCPYGKTEAWYVLEADRDAAVYLGWSHDVLPEELDRAREEQDSQWMLERMNRVPVRSGDGILVPAGLAHAIGEGVFVVEVQEPTDFSVVLEWSVTSSGREDSHLGLGFETAMKAVTHYALGVAGLDGLRRHVARGETAGFPLRCLPEEAEEFFRLHVVAPGRAGECPVEPGFAVVVVLEGEGALVSDEGSIAVERGQTYVLPAAFGAWEARGGVRLVVARPGVGWPVGVVREEAP